MCEFFLLISTHKQEKYNIGKAIKQFMRTDRT